MNHNEAFLGSDRRKTHVLGRCRVSPLAQCREVAGAESRRCSISADPRDRVAARELPAPRERMVRVSLHVSLAGERQHPALKGRLPLSVFSRTVGEAEHHTWSHSESGIPCTCS